MTEYWIPAADLLSAAVIGVCFLIAVIVINMQTAGRPRTLAVLGVASVLGGTMMQALNGSLAGAYGRDSLAYAVVAIDRGDPLRRRPGAPGARRHRSTQGDQVAG